MAAAPFLAPVFPASGDGPEGARAGEGFSLLYSVSCVSWFSHARRKLNEGLREGFGRVERWG